ncbi:MAG: phenylacetate--CoA ligase family protein [Deltaproteobacteria bacterium]|nr:phenylacetate--CoA ligase family protein [Deltaproteobacteria bacterium]
MIARKLACLAAAMRRQWAPPWELRKRQLVILQRLIAHAHERVPLWREKMRAAGVRPGDLRTLADLAALPLMTKEELRDGFPEHTCARPLEPSDHVFETSGSSGVMLRVPYDDAGNDFLDAIYGRALFSAGYRPWDRIAYFWWTKPRPLTPYERVGLMKKTVLPSEADPEEQLRMLARLQPRVIYNFPTSMALMARLIEQRGSRPVQPGIIVCHGELMTAEQRATIERAFGCDVFDQYGAQEFNRMAWDCRRHEGMHLDADSVIVEVLGPDGSPAGTDQEGELVVTGLAGFLTPLIRYRIGDIGLLRSRPCACGRSLPLLELTGGRSDDFLKLPDGRRVSPRMIVPRIELHTGYLQYRVVQRTPAEVDVMLVPAAGASDSLLVAIEAELRSLVGRGVDVRARFVDAIPLSGRGKLRAVVSEV